jgi:hypothetical protein
MFIENKNIFSFSGFRRFLHGHLCVSRVERIDFVPTSRNKERIVGDRRYCITIVPGVRCESTTTTYTKASDEANDDTNNCGSTHSGGNCDSVSGSVASGWNNIAKSGSLVTMGCATVMDRTVQGANSGR